ncbi:MAG: hypothetical protein ABW208_27155 [Pyrinomonadaceae bacterium]
MHRVRLEAFNNRAAALAVACLLLLSAAAGARANMAVRRPESRPGDAPREPAGGLKSVHILSETLVIDMRPLKGLRPAVVEANYRVRNDGETSRLLLVFVATARVSGEGYGPWVWSGTRWLQADKSSGDDRGVDRGVWLDGQPVDVILKGESEHARLPEEWAPPGSTPSLEPGGKPLPYEARGDDTIDYNVTLSPGDHTLRVRYVALPGAYANASSDAIYWQLGYVLSPAREWAGFGGLDVKVLLPSGWHAAARPEMRREGDALVAHWDALPADTLAVTAQTDEQTVYDPELFWKALLILGGLFTAPAAFAGWKLGAWLGRRGRTSAWGLLVSPLVVGLLYALSYVVASALSAPRAPEQAAFNQIGNYNLILTFLIFVAVVSWHFLVTQAATYVSRRRTKVG